MKHPLLIPMTVLLGALMLAHAAHAQPAPFADGTPAPPGVLFVQRESPVPHSVDLPGLFTADNVTLLPAVTEVFQPRQDPPLVARLYETDVRSDLAGLWSALGDGTLLWTMTILSPNAPSLRLRLEPFQLPAGCELIIYNGKDQAESYGPFTRSVSRELPFWAPTVFSNEVRVELYVPPEVDIPQVLSAIHITGVAQELLPNPEQYRACRIDVTCDPNWANEANGVGYMRFACSGGTCSCTGSMVTRLNADWALLFLSAAHCISTEAEANSLEVYWFYQTSTCNGAAPAWNTCPRTVGATLLAVNTTADNVLVGLTDAIPGGLWWNGWDSSGIPNPTNGVIIHHPSGDRKSISYGVYEGRDDNHCESSDIQYRLDLSDGGQEHGSSGCPGFDPAHRIRTVASCSDDPGCDAGENTWEGSFPNAYSTLSPFLDPQLDVWVNGTFAGTERGTQAAPWNTIIEGYFGVRSGGTIHIQSGSYPPITLRGTRSMRLQAEGGAVRIGS